VGARADETLSYEAFLAEFPAIQCHLRHWLTQGLLCPEDNTAETCRRLIALDSALWSFVTAPGVEPTNNATERARRHPVIWRRTSHGRNPTMGISSSNACWPWPKPVDAAPACLCLCSFGPVSLPNRVSCPVAPLCMIEASLAQPPERIPGNGPTHVAKFSRNTCASHHDCPELLIQLLRFKQKKRR
jgi:hypothetical protein